MKQSLTALYAQTQKRGMTTFYPIQGLEQITERIQDLVIANMAEFLTQNPLQDTDYYHAPDYYNPWPKFAGRELNRDTMSLDDASCFYWEELEMLDYFQQQDTQRVIQIMPEWAADYGVRILCDYSQPAHDQDYRTQELALPREQCCWGNTEILSQEDWDRLADDNFETTEHSDLIWHELDSYVHLTVWHILDDINDELELWSGVDGLQDRIGEMLATPEFRLQMTLFHNELNSMELTYEDWPTQIENLVARYEALHESVLAAV